MTCTRRGARLPCPGTCRFFCCQGAHKSEVYLLSQQLDAKVAILPTLDVEEFLEQGSHPLAHCNSNFFCFAPLVSTHSWCCIPSPTWCRCSLFCSGIGRKPRPASTISTSCRQQEENLEEHVRSVENRGAQHVVQLCTRQLGCMQNSTAHNTLTNMSLPSASSLESL